jgi:competence protein ComEA
MAERSRGTVLAWLVAAVVATFAVMRLIGGQAAPAASPLKIDRSPGAARGGGSRPAAAGVYVHVAGAVRRPGLVRVGEGARVAGAVARAGGPTRVADLTAVNLAAPVEDGQQVVVPARGAAGAAAAAPGAATPGAAAAAPGTAGAPKLSLSTATVDQLDEIDGIGPTLAERIVEYRTENGGFRSLDELREVEGIGEKRFETLEEALQL